MVHTVGAHREMTNWLGEVTGQSPIPWTLTPTARVHSLDPLSSTQRFAEKYDNTTSTTSHMILLKITTVSR